jgi:hypothetical protein
MKTKSLIAALLLAASSAFAQVPSYVPTNGLVGYWPFNGNANDESGNGNNGTPVNGVSLTADRNGNSNSAYNFDGIDDFISTPTITSINLNNSRTIGLWVFISQNQNGGFCLSQGPELFQSGCNEGFHVNATGPNADCGFSGCGVVTNCSQIRYPFNFLNGSWNHLLITYSSGGYSGLSFYINGNLISTTPSNCTQGSQYTSFNTGSLFGISFGKRNDNFYFNGQIDDIGIWNRALTQQEITALYNSQTCNSSSNTITADGPTTFCAGNSVNLKSDVVGGTYQWKKNGVNIATNSTSRTFKASSTGSYTCVATCNGTALTSNAIAVTSKTNASATVSASGATSFCAGDSVTLNATNLGSNYSVQWYRTNVSIENATNYSQIVKQPGTYKVVTKNLSNGCSRISGSAITTNVNCRIANYSSIPTTSEISAEERFDVSEFSNGIKIYPNPNNGSFQFKYEGEESGDAQLEVINTMGQTVYQTAVNIEDGFLLKEIMLGDNFQKGIYIVRLLINGGQNDSRVLIQ